MNHLTISQILQFVDGTADYAMQAVVSNHLAVCSVCRREVEFHKGLLRSARDLPATPVTEKFVGRVMSVISPRRQNAVAAWLLENMGAMFGMMVVLGVVAWAVMDPNALHFTKSESTTPAFFHNFQTDLSSGYAKLKEQFVADASRLQSPVKFEGRNKEIAVLGLVSLILLLLADRFLFARVFRTKR